MSRMTYSLAARRAFKNDSCRRLLVSNSVDRSHTLQLMRWKIIERKTMHPESATDHSKCSQLGASSASCLVLMMSSRYDMEALQKMKA